MTDADKRLDHALTELPRSVRPARDLWPEIEASIAAQDDFGGGYWALAAGWMLTAVGIGLLGWRLSTETVEVPAYPWADSGPQVHLALDATRMELRDDLGRAVAMLSPQDQTAIAVELNGSQAAREEVLTALQLSPENALLQQLAVSATHRELAVMQQITQLNYRISQRT